MGCRGGVPRGVSDQIRFAAGGCEGGVGALLGGCLRAARLVSACRGVGADDGARAAPAGLVMAVVAASAAKAVAMACSCQSARG